MGASTERDQDWRIWKARQCCNIKSLGTVGFGFSRADSQVGGRNSYSMLGEKAFLQAMETGRKFAYQASPSYDRQAFEAATEEERDGIARSAIHPANVARACLIAHAKAEACLAAELDVCGNASSAPFVLRLRKDVEATRVALEEAERVENLLQERLSVATKVRFREQHCSCAHCSRCDLAHPRSIRLLFTTSVSPSSTARPYSQAYYL
jgi:hypothetical protein